MMEKLLLLAVVGGLLARSRSAESSTPARSDKPARRDAPPAYVPPQSEQEELLWIPDNPPVLLNPSVLDLFDAPPGEDSSDLFIPGIPGTPSRGGGSGGAVTENPNAPYTHEGYPVPTRAQMRAFQQSLNSFRDTAGISQPRISTDGVFGGQTDALLRTLGEYQLAFLRGNPEVRQYLKGRCIAQATGLFTTPATAIRECENRYALPLNPQIAVPGVSGWFSAQARTGFYDIDAASRHFDLLAENWQ